MREHLRRFSRGEGRPSPPVLGRLVERFDRQVERLWEGRGMAA